MARPWRIEYEGAYYHVLSRGNEGKDIFYDDKDRKVFIEIMGEVSQRFDVDLFAFVLMSNTIISFCEPTVRIFPGPCNGYVM